MDDFSNLCKIFAIGNNAPVYQIFYYINSLCTRTGLWIKEVQPQYLALLTSGERLEKMIQ